MNPTQMLTTANCNWSSLQCSICTA